MVYYEVQMIHLVSIHIEKFVYSTLCSKYTCSIGIWPFAYLDELTNFKWHSSARQGADDKAVGRAPGLISAHLPVSCLLLLSRAPLGSFVAMPHKIAALPISPFKADCCTDCPCSGGGQKKGKKPSQHSRPQSRFSFLAKIHNCMSFFSCYKRCVAT